MIIQIVKLKTSLSEDELTAVAQERKPQFVDLPGLVQKYYVKLDEPNQYWGVYLWDSVESMTAFRNSELAATIPAAYQLTEAPQIETHEVLFPLRD